MPLSVVAPVGTGGVTPALAAGTTLFLDTDATLLTTTSVGAATGGRSISSGLATGMSTT